MCGSHENDEAWGVTKGSQHWDNPNCCKRVRKMRGGDRLCLWERGTAENTPRAHGLTLRWAESLISTDDSHKLGKQSQASARGCAQSYASSLHHSHSGIALQGTSSQLLTLGSILNVYLLIWVLSNMAHIGDLLLVVISINNTTNGHTYMLMSRGYKCGFSRTERAEGNSDLPTAREGCQPPPMG